MELQNNIAELEKVGTRELGIKKPSYIESPEDLEIFKKSFLASLAVHKISLSLPKIEQYDLASQLRRGSKSICANIVEGFGRQSYYPKEFIKFLTNALGSAWEVKLWLKYCNELGYINNELSNKLRNEYEVIIKMLRSMRSKIGD